MPEELRINVQSVSGPVIQRCGIIRMQNKGINTVISPGVLTVII